MTDAAAALADTAKLGQFDGRDVIRTTVAVTNAGDGLSEAMSIDPQELHLGQTVYMVVEAQVAKIRHEPIKDTQALTRVHILRAGTATLVDASLVEEVLDTQRQRIDRAREQAKGTQRLPVPEELAIQHAEGAHDVAPVEGCEACDAAAET